MLYSVQISEVTHDHGVSKDINSTGSKVSSGMLITCGPYPWL